MPFLKDFLINNSTKIILWKIIPGELSEKHLNEDDKKLLKGKNIVVTGGGTGLGKSMAERFSDLGANLVLTSRREKVINDTAKEFRKRRKKAIPIVCDVRYPDQVESMINQAVDQLGSVDILVNNAAGNFISPTENLSSNAFKTVVDIVLNGTFHCSQAAGKIMRKNKSGVILNIVTTYAWTGSGYVVPVSYTHLTLPTKA